MTTDLSPAKQALLLRRLHGTAPGPQSGTIGRRPAGTPAPLSFAQRRMWFLEQLEPGGTAFHIPLVLRLRGPLDPDQLETAWNVVRQRHEGLRTSFGEEFQQVAGYQPAPLPRQDLSTRADPEQAARELAQHELAQPFDLGTGPLWRMRLLRLGTDHHVLVLVIHHSIGDEHSIKVLMTDLARAYTGGEVPEPELQYGDVALWQRERLTTERVERQVEFWRQALAGAPALLELPTDGPRPAVPDPAVGHAFRWLPATVRTPLDRLAAAENATAFMALLTGYAVLLARYSGQDELCVGVPVAGRGAPELERVVGCLLNTLVMRVRLTGGATFRELLRRTRRVVLDAFGHADLPFEQLVEQLRPERSLAYTPLFQAMFNLLDGGAAPPLALPGIAVEYLASATVEAAKTDLSLTASQGPNGLGLQLFYRKELFSPQTADDLLDRYVELLTAAASHPDRDWRDLLAGDRATAAASPPSPPAGGETTVVAMVESQVAAAPEVPALISGDRAVTYQQLNQRANRLAHALRNRGVHPGVLVGIEMDRSIDLVVAVFGVLKAGGAYLPLDPSHPPARREAILARAAPALVLRAPDESWLAGPDHNPAPQSGPDDLAYVVHTSGSTGLPKGVLAHHRAVANYLAFLRQRYRLGPADTVLQIAGLSFDASVRDLLGPLAAGATVVLLEPDQAKEPAAMLDLIHQHRVTCLLSVVPTLLRALVTVGSPAAPALRLVLCSGERLYRRDVTGAVALFGPQVRIVNQYGPTECTMTSTFHVATADAAAKAAPEEPVPAGQPIPGAAIYLLDHRDRPVPPGMPGEVYIGGIGVAGGYLGDPAQTRERFRPDPFAGRPAAMMYRTGDRGRLRRDGTLIFLGRLDDQAKIRGIRVEPGEVEAVLRGAAGVREAAAVVVADRLVGYVTGAADPVAVREHAARLLPDYLVPAVVVGLDALPLTPNGKLDRQALPAPPAPSSSVAYVAPRDLAEQQVADAFAEVLGVAPDSAQIGAHHNFFDSGGDSFAAVKVTRLVGRGMRVMDLFRYPTVAELAAALASGTNQDDRMLVRLRPARSGAAAVSLICVPYAGGSPVSFQPLAAALPPQYAVYGLALPGNDLGRPDEHRQDLMEVASTAVEQILSDVDGPVAVYGHCSGTALAVELTRQLEAAGRRVERLYLAAGFPNTRLPGRLLGRFTLDRLRGDRLLQNFFRTMGGFGEELTPEEVRLITGSLRHDSRAAEEYFTRTLDDPDRHRLAAPITCIVGDGDPLTRYYNERYREWGAYSDRVGLVVLERAGHYFLRHRAQALASLMTRPDRPRTVAAADDPGTVKRGFAVFAAVATTEFATLISSGMIGFAFGVWAFQRTGSAAVLGIISLCAMLPGLLVSPLVGAVVDRVDRRKVMLAANLTFIASGLATLALLWTDQLQIWHLYGFASWFSIWNGFLRVAYTAAVPQLIPKRYLGRANGVALSGPAVAQVFAPLLAGGLVVYIGLFWLIVIDVGVFLVAAATLALVRFPNRLSRRSLEPVLVEIAGGWRYLIRQRNLVALLSHAAICNLLLAMAVVLVTPLVLRSYDDPSRLGIVMAAGGIGAALGGLAMALWGGPARLIPGFLGFASAAGLGIALLGAAPTIAVMVVGILSYWGFLNISNACYTVLIQVKVPHHLHGRIFAMNQVVAFSTMPVGFVLAGTLADSLMEPMMAPDGALAGTLGQVLGTGPGRGVALLMVLVGLLLCAVNASGFLRPRLRRFEQEVPDAHPDEALAVAPPDEVRLLERTQ